MSSNKNLAYGLNSRNTKKKGLSSFGGDSSDSNSDEDVGDTNQHKPVGGGARSAINREIAAEQSALRKRAEAAMAKSSLADSAVYDYDGEYDSFASGKKLEEEKKAAAAAARRADPPKESRYVSGLLKAAQRRTQEQEIIYERKVAKDQAVEDAEMQYDGKEKFITSSYKRKLAEREAWVQQEKEREKKEEDEDVTKKKGGNFLFTSGFAKNAVLGVGGDEDRKGSGDVNDGGRKPDNHRENKRDNQQEDSSQDTERWGSSKRHRESRDSHYSIDKQQQHSMYRGGDAGNGTDASNEVKEKIAPKNRSQILAERTIKIREARERYFERRGISPSQ